MIRKLPTIIAFAFIAITLWRVAQFAGQRMGGGWTGWVFSICLGVGVYLSSYWTRDSITAKDGKTDRRNTNVKVWAWGSLVFFVLTDGLYNLAETWLTVNPKETDWLLIVTTAVFGVSPTVAAAILGALQGHIDRLPKPPVSEKSSIVVALKRRIVAALQPAETEPVVIPAKVEPAAQLSKPEPQPEPQPEQPAPLPQPSTLQGTRLAVYNLLSDGFTTTEAATQLNISRQAVDKHRRALIYAGILNSAAEPAPAPNGRAH
jgi:DNA-binding CsgD family transcriptional regulator